jgi:hypothetical protein
VLVALGGSRANAGSGISGDSPLARVPRGLARSLARSSLLTAVGLVLAVVLLLAAASPVLHGETRPFSAADLPAGSPARAAEAIGAGDAGADTATETVSISRPVGASLFEKLALAAAVSAGALAIVLAAAFRSIRVVPVATATLLPAAAACGIAVLLFQDGHLAAALDQERQGALETGALASAVAALAAIGAFRGVIAIRGAREERSLGQAPDRAAETTAGFSLPAAMVATLVGAAGAAVLAGADLYSAREFGQIVAVGLALDLVLLRTPLISALARWGGG